MKSHFDMSDDERRAERKRLRRELAEHSLKKSRLAELHQQIAAVDAEADKAANEHQERCEPIQAELQSIHSKQVDALTAQKPADKKLEKRRLELLGELATHNTALEAVAERCKAMKKPLAIEAKQLTNEVAAGAALPSQLSRTASLPLHHELWVHQRTVEFAQQRLKISARKQSEAAAMLKKAESDPTHFNVAGQQRLADRWALEVDTCRDLLDAARQASEAVQARMMDD